jgi:hypothetical protein
MRRAASLLDARLLALVLWAVFVDWLWLSGEWRAYVGPRTAWIMPFGSVALTAAALTLAAVRTRSGASPELSARSLAGALVLCAPMSLLAIAPGSTLGAYAVARRTPASAADLPLPDHRPGAAPSLFEVAVAGARPDVASARGIRDGMHVELRGLVSAARGARDIDLSRFLSNCCAADALVYTVPVDLRGAGLDDEQPFPLDAWLRVSGTLRREGRGLELTADRVEEIDPPDNPFQDTN